MLTIKNTRKIGPGFFDTKDIINEASAAKGDYKRPTASSRAGTQVVTNIAFATTINIHPKSDPREPRFVAPEREDMLDQKDELASKCCWPFKLCC